ncbi:MAG: glycosyl hydrolase [Planctomycetota bacterium]|nr:MAG: glycosyl hydrolase [Planctomycetota bacterium]
MTARAPEPDSGSAPHIVAVVLNWNGGEETGDCLRALRAVEGLRPQILLADNGSVDGSVATLRAEDPEMQVLELDTNHGYAGGNNRAMRHAFGELDAEWVCLLNSDLVVSPGLFSGMAAAVERASAAGGAPVGAVGPCLLYRDRPEVIWACGGSVAASLNVTTLLQHDRPYVPVKAVDHEVEYLPGACLMISRDAWEAVGGLDESFFCYLEDADWCLRLRAAGFRVLATPSVTAWHGLSTSTGGGYSAGRKYMTAVNSVHFLRKHGTWRGWAALFLFDVALWPLAFLRRLPTGRAAGAWAKLRGVIDGLRGVHIDASVAERFARRPT